MYAGIIIYAVAMALANLSVAMFGPWVTPINSFVLIGLDLSLRDWLHMRLKAWQMLTLIVSSGAVTYLINPYAGRIAVASSVAFTLAAMVDWVTFSKLKGSWMFRSNGSNVTGAMVDSVTFPTIAFGIFMPEIIAAQMVAKIMGGFVWAGIISGLWREAQKKKGERKCSNGSQINYFQN